MWCSCVCAYIGGQAKGCESKSVFLGSSGTLAFSPTLCSLGGAQGLGNSTCQRFKLREVSPERDVQEAATSGSQARGRTQDQTTRIRGKVYLWTPGPGGLKDMGLARVGGTFRDLIPARGKCRVELDCRKCGVCSERPASVRFAPCSSRVSDGGKLDLNETWGSVCHEDRAGVGQRQHVMYLMSPACPLQRRQ